ncbi:TPA: LysM peptidoglycan-binding domain-containing protein, partial [Streptococcus suis]
MKKFNFGYRKVGKVLVACAVAVATFGVASVASADTWVANSPESIQLVPGQSTYELKPGDTLWAISQKINSSVEELAQLNGINLLAGEEKRLSVGRQIVLPGADVSTSTVEKNQADEVTSDGVVNTNLSTANVNVVDASSVLSVEELLERVESVEVTDGATYVKLKDGESIDDFVKDLEEATKETPKPVVPGAEEIPVKPLDPIVPETPIDVTKEEPLITDKGEGVTHELPILPIEIVEEDSKEANSGEVTVGKDGEIQKVKKLKENIILYSYMPDGDWTKANGVNFYVSDVKSPNKLELVSQIGSDVIDGRDPSLFVSKDKEIFVAVTKYSKEIGSEVRIYKTNDLLNFESFDLDLGINKITGNSSYYWAPDFFQDLDGKVYLTISAGPNLKNFSQYISEIN